jgi:hypothetical protein
MRASADEEVFMNGARYGLRCGSCDPVGGSSAGSVARGLVSLSLLLVAQSPVRAEQFVLFDATFTFTQEDALNSKPSQSHYYIKEDGLNPQRPRDWTSPIDYRNGTVHLRLEVLEKPAGDQPTSWSVCYIPYKGRNHGYGCIGTGPYAGTGVIEKDLAMTKFWQNDDIVWSEGIKEMHLVLKDDKNLHAHKRPDPEKFFPTKVRMTLTQVSKGSTYAPVPVSQRSGAPPK